MRGGAGFLLRGVRGKLDVGAFTEDMLRAFLTDLSRTLVFGVGDGLSAGLFLTSGASPEMAGTEARRVSLCAVAGRL